MAGGIENWFNSIGRQPGVMQNVLNAVGIRDDKPAPTPQQAQQQITGTATRSPEEMVRLNAQAKAAGYPDYETMKLYMLQRQKGGGGGSRGSMGNREMLPGQTVDTITENAMGMHPKTVFQNLSDMFSRINGGE